MLHLPIPNTWTSSSALAQAGAESKKRKQGKGQCAPASGAAAEALEDAEKKKKQGQEYKQKQGKGCLAPAEDESSSVMVVDGQDRKHKKKKKKECRNKMGAEDPNATEHPDSDVSKRSADVCKVRKIPDPPLYVDVEEDDEEILSRQHSRQPGNHNHPRMHKDYRDLADSIQNAIRGCIQQSKGGGNPSLVPVRL